MGRRDGEYEKCLLTIFGRAKDLSWNEFGIDGDEGDVGPFVL
jgi:hypothetical protein